MKERTDAVRVARKKFYALRARHKEEERRAREEWDTVALEQIRLAETGSEIAEFFRSLPYADGSSARNKAEARVLELCDSVDTVRATYRKYPFVVLLEVRNRLSLVEVEAAKTTAELVHAAKRSLPFMIAVRNFCTKTAAAVAFAAFRKFLSGCKDKEECGTLVRTFGLDEWKNDERRWCLWSVADDVFWERLKELGWEPIEWDNRFIECHGDNTGISKKRPYFLWEREQKASGNDQ